MLVGVLSGDSVAQLYALSRNAPLPMINPIIVYLSHPDEKINPSYVHAVQGVETTISLRPVLYRHLYNPTSGLSEFVAGFQLLESRESLLGIVDPRKDFVPYARLCVDGMRSYSTRAYCRSYSNALTGFTLDFTLAWAERGNEAHQVMFDDFNPEAEVELSMTQSFGANFGQS